MNAFWIWFWKPIAEFLGGLFLVVAVTLVLLAFCFASAGLEKVYFKRGRKK